MKLGFEVAGVAACSTLGARHRAGSLAQNDNFRFMPNMLRSLMSLAARVDS